MSAQDQSDIRDLVSSYADAVCRRDKDAWAANWDEDCVWVLPGAGETRGREAVVNLWSMAMPRFPFVMQLVLNGLVEIAPDGVHAEGRWYLNEHMTIAGGGGAFNIGLYQDRYVKRGDRWLFAERHYTILYNDKGNGDMSGDVAAFPPLVTLKK
jgi:ketosteroid isomerase-like protein